MNWLCDDKARRARRFGQPCVAGFRSHTTSNLSWARSWCLKKKFTGHASGLRLHYRLFRGRVQRLGTTRAAILWPRRQAAKEDEETQHLSLRLRRFAPWRSEQCGWNFRALDAPLNSTQNDSKA